MRVGLTTKTIIINNIHLQKRVDFVKEKFGYEACCDKAWYGRSHVFRRFCGTPEINTSYIATVMALERDVDSTKIVRSMRYDFPPCRDL